MNRKIILASHGDLSVGVLDSLRMIIGEIPYEIETYTLKSGNIAEDYANELKKEIEQNPSKEYVIVTDVYGASVCSAMYRLTEYNNVKLFTGMNLNMLLCICMEHDHPLTNLDVDQIIEDSKKGVQSITLNTEEIEEDF